MIIFLGGCFLTGKNDLEIRDECLTQVFSAFDSRNPQKIKQLFAKNALKEIDNIDQDVSDLIEYYSGSYETFFDRRGGAAVYDYVHYGKTTKELEICVDFQTDTQNYRMAIKYIAIDDFDEDNIGIWYIYIIKSEDDTDLNFVYTGDGKYTTGIHIGIKNVIDF